MVFNSHYFTRFLPPATTEEKIKNWGRSSPRTSSRALGKDRDENGKPDVFLSGPKGNVGRGTRPLCEELLAQCERERERELLGDISTTKVFRKKEIRPWLMRLGAKAALEALGSCGRIIPECKLARNGALSDMASHQLRSGPRCARIRQLRPPTNCFQRTTEPVPPRRRFPSTR